MDLKPLELTIRVRAKDEGLNARKGQSARATRNQLWKSAVRRHALEMEWPKQLPYKRAIIRLTAVAASGPEPDDDNLPGMLKGCRDALAAWFELDDSPRGPIEWVYRWKRGANGTTVEVLDASLLVYLPGCACGKAT